MNDNEQNAIVVFITTDSRKDAERIAQILVERKLAACVQIVPEIVSIYRWQDAIQQDSEVLMFVKTLESKFDELEKVVRENHPYDVPEIVAIKANRVSTPYFNWLKESVD